MSDAYVQSHIHLAPTLGSAPENAPTVKWVVTTRSQIPVFDIQVQRSLTGVPFGYVLKKAGVPILHQDFSYTIRLEGDADQGLVGTNTVWDYQDLLIGMIGYPLYLVDNRHPVDGTDHSSFVRPVMITKIADLKDEHPLLRYFNVQVYLNDMTIPA